MWKEPLDLANSFWKRPRTREESHERLRKQLEYYRQALHLFEQQNIPVLVVPLANLLRQPGRMLKRICEEIGISYFPGKERYWNFEHHHLYGAAVQKAQIKDPLSASYEMRTRDPNFPEDRYHSLIDEYADVADRIRSMCLEPTCTVADVRSSC
jgi:hypothetical protein